MISKVDKIKIPRKELISRYKFTSEYAWLFGQMKLMMMG